MAKFKCGVSKGRVNIYSVKLFLDEMRRDKRYGRRGKRVKVKVGLG